MQYRTFGRTGWEVSEIGYGMWGMAGWKGSDDDESASSLDLAFDLGCNFFDTAWAYGSGKSEQLLGDLVRRHPGERIYTASKVPPKNMKWPPMPGNTLDDCYPPEHITEYVDKTLANLRLETVDLIQLHTWDDSWADDDRWIETAERLKDAGKIRAFGLSLNRWQPENGLKAIRTGHVDSIQAIYNIFDQAPEDELLPLCREMNAGFIARVPFDEGTLTGNLTLDTTFPEGDWRNTYFVPENLKKSVEHAEKLRPVIPDGMTMPELALRFILSNPDIGTTIPGMRKSGHVRSNTGASDGNGLPDSLLAELKQHRWDRRPTKWSQ